MLYTNTELAKKLKARRAKRLFHRFSSAFLTGFFLVALAVLAILSLLAGIIDWFRSKLQKKFIFRQINVLDKKTGWKFRLFEAVRRRG